MAGQASGSTPLPRGPLAHLGHHHAAAFTALYTTWQTTGVLRVTLSGFVYAEPPRFDPASAQRQLMAIFAGYAAEERFDPERVAVMSAEDAVTARKCLIVLARSQPDVDLGRKLREAAEELVADRWPSIEPLAAELVNRGSVPADHAELILEDAEGLEPARSALSCRRLRVPTLKVA